MKNPCLLLLLSFFIICLAKPSIAQQDSTQTDAEALAVKLSNPAAVVGTMNFFPDFTHYTGTHPDAQQSAFSVTFQPALPVPLKNGMGLFFRPLLPIIFTTPLLSANGTEFVSSGTQLGNMGFDLSVGKTNEKGFMYLVGMAGTIPTATHSEMQGQWALGPELALASVKKTFVYGVLISQLWGIQNVVEKTNILNGQYFYAKPLGGGKVIGAGPTWSYNWNTEKFTLPLGTGYSVTKMVGKTPLKLGFQFWYYLARDDFFGSEWTIRFQITPVVPLPWGNK
jgi:hypothetical protein